MLEGKRKINYRNCPICHSSEKKDLFTQKYSAKFSHVISVCTRCGCTYVSNTPSQKYYEEYYKVMSKYEHERDGLLHELYASIIRENCSSEASILDIGCSTGHLLHLLQKKGFSNIYGIDPSPLCRKLAKEKYNISIQTADLFHFTPKRKYSVAILAMVMEHLNDAQKAIKKTASLIEDDGYIFISVPDAKNFYRDFEEPFGEFSVEHINFYSSEILFTLMKDFSCVYFRTDEKNIYSLWRKSPKSLLSMKKYILESKKKLKKIKTTINKLPQQVLVWGAGSLTQRLLMTTALKRKVFKFIDSDPKLHGTFIEGKEIISPMKAKYYNYPIFISSYRFKDEIKEYIKKEKISKNVLVFE